MATIIEVKAKYCDKCEHQSYCYKPCPLALAALWNMDCEKVILHICKKDK